MLHIESPMPHWTFYMSFPIYFVLDGMMNFVEGKKKLVGFTEYYYGNENVVTKYDPVVDLDGKDTLLKWDEKTQSFYSYHIRDKENYIPLTKDGVLVAKNELIIAAGIHVINNLRYVPSMIEWYCLFKSWEPFVTPIQRQDSTFLNTEIIAEKGFYWTIGNDKIFREYADAYISDVQEAILHAIREKPKIPVPHFYEDLIKPFYSKKREHRLWRVALFPKSKMVDWYASEAVNAGDAENVYDFKDQVLSLQQELEIPVGVYGDIETYVK